MFYGARIQIAALVALLIHLTGLVFLAYVLNKPSPPRTAEARGRPIVLTLNTPLQTERIPRLIESGAPTEEPIAETDLISDADTKAQDDSGLPGETNSPRVDELDDFDQLATPAIPPPGQIVEPSEVNSAEADSQAEAQPVEEVSQEEPTTESIAEAEPLAETQPAAAEVSTPIPESNTPDALQTITLLSESNEEPESPTTAIESDDSEPETNAADSAVDSESVADEEANEVPERFEVAQAAGVPSVEPQELHVTRGREPGGSEQSGFTSFEANKHEMGEYMLSVRRAVERQWLAGLQLRYSGVTRTHALIECSIRPDGTVEYARILEAGGSMSYAILCREAILRAAPYGPFPFDVPDIYREENLEIVWKFSFL